MCGGGKEEASAEAPNEVEDEAEDEVDDEEKGWKRSGSATVAAADEEAAGGAVMDLTCEWGGVGGMGAVGRALIACTWSATCDDPSNRSP